VGTRLTGASLRPFKHNDMNDLERVLRSAISQGQPRTHRPWKKIIVIVEGLYSMEGTMCNLPRAVQLKHKYKVCSLLVCNSANPTRRIAIRSRESRPRCLLSPSFLVLPIRRRGPLHRCTRAPRPRYLRLLQPSYGLRRPPYGHVHQIVRCFRWLHLW